MAGQGRGRRRGPLPAVLVLLLVAASGLLALARVVGPSTDTVGPGPADPAVPSEATATQPAPSGWAPPTLAAPARADHRGTPDEVADATLAGLVDRAPVVVVADASRPEVFTAAVDLASSLVAPIVAGAAPRTAGGATASPDPAEDRVTALVEHWRTTEVVVVGDVSVPAVGGPVRVHRVDVRSSATPSASPTASGAASPATSPTSSPPASPAMPPAPAAELGLPDEVARMVDDAGEAGVVAPTSEAVVVLRAAADLEVERPDLGVALEQWDVQAVRWRRDDPRHDARLRRRLADVVDHMVLAVPTADRPAPRKGPWVRRITNAVTAPALPGGGTALFPGRVFIASYGNPIGPALGVLGERDAEGSIAWIEDQAAAYDGLFGPDVQVQPAFEIIATIASARIESTGDYSRREDLDLVTEWVDAATDAGLYVVLDLQPGRTDFLTQARELRSLLVRPNVGLALDPEWRLGPTEFHMRQIGSVTTAEVNRVSAWLARLVRRNNLPEKLLIIHSFRLDMLTDREDLVDRWELAEMIHVDGQGWQGAKDDTYEVITEAGPDFLAWGWKNFFDEDVPGIRSPEDTALVQPRPNFISYQ